VAIGQRDRLPCDLTWQAQYLDRASIDHSGLRQWNLRLNCQQ
jgi:hypothetical protein